MIDKENCYLLGRIRKATGFTGEVVITIDLNLPENDVDFEFLHLEIDGALIPFFIQEMEISSAKSMKVSFMDVPDQEKARKLVDLTVYIEKSQIPAETDNPMLGGIEGYAVIDETIGLIGQIHSILQNPGQDLLVVMNGKKEILIPVAEEIILFIDEEKKEVKVDLPEGLADLNE